MLSERDVRMIKRLVMRLPSADQAPAPVKLTAWKFINSSFGIFLLSSVFLSGLTFAYSTWRDAVEAKVLATESTKRLDLELTSRFAQLEPLKSPTFTYSTLLTSRAATTGESLPNVLDRFYVVFPEYRDRSAVSLLWELKSLVPVEQSEHVEAALQAARSIPRFLGRDRVELVTPRGEQDSVWRFKENSYADFEKNVLGKFRQERWSR